MPPGPGSIPVFYAVLIAPGFIAVMTAISLAAVEDDHSQFVLLIWSLVVSLVIDIIFLTGYQTLYGPITSFDQLSGILFTPYFRVDLIATISLFAVLVGVAGAAALLLNVPEKGRRLIQAKARIKYNPRQPWENFMRQAGAVRVKTTDDQLYSGEVVEWSRAGRPHQLRLTNPYRYNEDIHVYEPMGREDMLFFQDDIDRVLMQSTDDAIVPPPDRDSLWTRTKAVARNAASFTHDWLAKRILTMWLMALLILWFSIQLVTAVYIGVEEAIPLFYFTPELSLGWLVAPISHNMHDPDHLVGNVALLAVVGAFAEPYFSRRQYLALLTGLAVASVWAPAVALMLTDEGMWMVAGASGGIYGLWAFMAVYRRDLVSWGWDWLLPSDGQLFGEYVQGILVALGFVLLVAAPVVDVFVAGQASSTVSHVVGIVAGYGAAAVLAYRGVQYQEVSNRPAAGNR